MGSEIKALSRKFFVDIFSKGNLSLVDDYAAADYEDHDPYNPFPVRGRDGLKKLVSFYRSAFPDLEMIIEDEVAEGEKVVTRWRAEGTHKGDLMGIAPTGKHVSVEGVSETIYVKGKAKETWSSWDALGMFRQLGVAPPLR